MKILLYGDLQINGKNSDYMRFLYGSMQNMLEVINNEKPDLVVNLGDLMDTKHLISVEDLVWAWNINQQIERICKSHLILKGNHDVSDRNGDVSTVQVFNSSVTKAVTNFDEMYFNTKRFISIPYTRDIESVKRDLRSISNPEDIVAIFGHVDWIGCRLTPSFVTNHGLDPDEVMEMFPNSHIFNGHYHHPFSMDRLHFVGSPLHKDFNDVLGEVPRGFTLFDTETKSVRRIENSSTYYCVSVPVGTVESMETFVSGVSDMKSRIKVKVSVPNSLVDEASDVFDGFLWKSIIPRDSEVVSIYGGTGLGILSSSKEIVSKAIESSPDNLDRGILESIGNVIFSPQVKQNEV